MPQDSVMQDFGVSSFTEPATRPIQDHQVNQRVDLMELAVVLLHGKKIILGFTLATVVLTGILVFGVMKPTYTAEAVFLPPQSSPGSAISQLASQFGSLGVVSGLGSLKGTGEIYVGILESRTIADALIDQFSLQKVYKTKKLSDTEKALMNHSKFIVGKDTLVTIAVEDHDPKRAADLANGYMDLLHRQSGRLALTESAQRRLFFEEQLEREKNALADAEVELKSTQERTGLISPNGQTQVEIEAIAEVRAQITSREVELSALKQAATDLNPQVVRIQTEIADLQRQLQKLQNDSGKREPGSVQLPTSKVPEFALEYVRKQREVKYHEVLFELIAKQYEVARMDEARDAPVLQVVDHAVIPDKKSGPRRVLWLIAGCILGALAGVAWVVVRAAMAKMRAEPASAAKLDVLRQAASR